MRSSGTREALSGSSSQGVGGRPVVGRPGGVLTPSQPNRRSRVGAVNRIGVGFVVSAGGGLTGFSAVPGAPSVWVSWDVISGSGCARRGVAAGGEFAAEPGQALAPQADQSPADHHLEQV